VGLATCPCDPKRRGAFIARFVRNLSGKIAHLHISWKRMVRTRGLEPPTLSGPDPKSGASAIPPRAQRGQNALLTRFPQSGCCHFADQTASSVRFTSAGFPRQVPRAQPVQLLRLLERRKRRSFPDMTLPTQPKERSIDSSKTRYLLDFAGLALLYFNNEFDY
jgi:hypothetical protein